MKSAEILKSAEDITITTAIREVVEKMLNPAAVAAAAAAARHPVSEFQPQDA